MCHILILYAYFIQVRPSSSVARPIVESGTYARIFSRFLFSLLPVSHVGYCRPAIASALIARAVLLSFIGGYTIKSYNHAFITSQAPCDLKLETATEFNVI